MERPSGSGWNWASEVWLGPNSEARLAGWTGTRAFVATGRDYGRFSVERESEQGIVDLASHESCADL